MEKTDFLNNKFVDRLIKLALEEDMGENFQKEIEFENGGNPGINGDITSISIIDIDKKAEAKLIYKESSIIAGLPLIDKIYKEIGNDIEAEYFFKDGDFVEAGTVAAVIKGSARKLLMGERTVLNFLQRLSGIANHTSHFIRNILEIPDVKIIDTRKTTPGMRMLEKYAVKIGGGDNHRIGLYDMILIKDNHIAVAGSITEAVDKVRTYLKEKDSENVLVEVETADRNQVEEALACNVDRIMLDNMDTIMMHEMVAYVDGRIPLEASGGIQQHTIKLVAETGVDYISIGALTHSAKAADISLKIKVD